MPVFNYTGRSRRGELSSGLMEGDTRDSVASRLFNNGITPIEIRPAQTKNDGDIGKLLRTFGIGKPTTNDLVMFSRQMYTITKSGIPLLRGIKGLAASTHNPMLRETLEDVLTNLEGGRDLAGSLAHMHANRLLRDAARAQELVIYDFLARLYQGARARRRPA